MLKHVTAALRGAVALCLKTVAVITFLVALTVGMLLAPQYLPVPNAWAEYASGAIKGFSVLTLIPESIKSSNGALFAFGQLLSFEDADNSVARTESQFSSCVDTVDKICKALPGFVHSISCFGTDAAATAGRVRLVDDATVTGTAANEVWGAEFSTALQQPVGAVLDEVMTRGIHLDFTTTADVKCTVSFR